LHPYKLVKDTRTGVERTDAQKVLDGDLDDYIKGFCWLFRRISKAGRD